MAKIGGKKFIPLFHQFHWKSNGNPGFRSESPCLQHVWAVSPNSLGYFCFLPKNPFWEFVIKTVWFANKIHALCVHCGKSVIPFNPGRNFKSVETNRDRSNLARRQIFPRIRNGWKKQWKAKTAKKCQNLKKSKAWFPGLAACLRGAAEAWGIVQGYKTGSSAVPSQSELPENTGFSHSIHHDRSKSPVLQGIPRWVGPQPGSAAFESVLKKPTSFVEESIMSIQRNMWCSWSQRLYFWTHGSSGSRGGPWGPGPTPLPLRFLQNHAVFRQF